MEPRRLALLVTSEPGAGNEWSQSQGVRRRWSGMELECVAPRLSLELEG